MKTKINPQGGSKNGAHRIKEKILNFDALSSCFLKFFILFELEDFQSA